MRIVFLFLFFTSTCLSAQPAWQKLVNCELADGFRDGDSFVVRIASGERYVFRLYFVDTPEDTADQRFPSRVAEQARYFGISPEDAARLGDAAAEFTARALSKPFVVWTCWQRAPGASARPRYYAIVFVGNQRLSSMLIENGLARIYGKRITLPCGMTSRDYIGKLEQLEQRAKAGAIGGWKPAGGSAR